MPFQGFPIRLDDGATEVTTMTTLLGIAGLLALLATGVALMIYNDRRQEKMRRY